MADLPDLRTRRLWLRQWRAEDVDALHAIWTDAGVRRYLWDDKIIVRDRAAEVVAETLALIAERGVGMWSIWTGAEPAMVGFCGFREMIDTDALELVYGILPEFWGQEMVLEAARAVLRDGFDRCGFESITALADPPNKASFRVMEKLGMKFERDGMSHGLPARFYRIDAAEFARTL